MVLKCPTGYLFRWIGVEGGEAFENGRGEDPWDSRRGKGLGRSAPRSQIHPKSHSPDLGLFNFSRKDIRCQDIRQILRVFP
jgi:hypothetical protein